MATTPPLSPLAGYSSWMADNLALLGSQQLQHIVFPGSHDAGMYATTDCSVGAATCNTHTQDSTILQQLQAGSRYFDIRPTVYNKELYTAHLTLVPVVGTSLGCNGPLISDILTQVSEFMKTSGDLVILKFSHYIDRDAGVGKFSQQQMSELINLVTSQLKGVLYDQAAPAAGLATVPLSSFIGSGGRVLAVFDLLPASLRQAGIYSYADRGQGPADLVVFDSYANSNDLTTMQNDQQGKLDNANNHGNSLFLLSWTLTQSAVQAAGCVLSGESILSLAAQADASLWPTLYQWQTTSLITSTLIPNILYLDAYGTFGADVAMWLNKQLLSSSKS